MVEGKEKKKEKKKRTNKFEINGEMEGDEGRKKMSGKNECQTIWRQRIIDTFIVQHTG